MLKKGKDWHCRTCKTPIRNRWKFWKEEKLWEFLTKCPKCGDCVMHYKQYSKKR